MKLSTEDLNELYALGRWISRCASINGPAGTTAYLIKKEKMDELRALISRLERGE